MAKQSILTLLSALSLASAASFWPFDLDPNLTTLPSSAPSGAAVPNGATVVTGLVGSQTVQETFVPTVLSQYISLSSTLTIVPSISGTSVPPVVVGTGGVAWAPWNQGSEDLAPPSVLPGGPAQTGGSTIPSSSGSASSGPASSGPTSASVSSATSNAAPLLIVTSSYDPGAVTQTSVDPTVTANTAIKTSDGSHPVGLYPFIKGGPSCFFCPPGLEKGGFFLFGMNKPGIFPPPPTPPFPNVKNFPTITIGNDLKPTPDTDEKDPSSSPSASSPAPTTLSTSSVPSSTASSCSNALTASDCSVVCSTASGASASSGCSTSCYSTITGCSVVGSTTTSTASGSACSGAPAWSNVVTGSDFRDVFSSISLSPPSSSSGSAPPPSSSSAPPPPPSSSSVPPPPPSSSSVPPPPPSSTAAAAPPPAQTTQCAKGDWASSDIGADGPSGGLGIESCACGHGTTLPTDNKCCDNNCICQFSCIPNPSNKLRNRADMANGNRLSRIMGKESRRRFVERAVHSTTLELNNMQPKLESRAGGSDPTWQKYAGKGKQYWNAWSSKTGPDSVLPCNFETYFKSVDPRLVTPGDAWFLKEEGIQPGQTYYSTTATKPGDDEDGIFANTMSPKEGVFLAQDNYRGSVNQDDGTKTPAVPYHFSDIAWWQWQRSVKADNVGADQSTLDFSGMKYFFRTEIKNPDTQNIIDQAFEVNNVEDKTQTQTFTPDKPQDLNNAFWALLGTPNGNGIIHLLTDYKQAMHQKSIVSIKIIRPDDKTYYMWATLSP